MNLPLQYTLKYIPKHTHTSTAIKSIIYKEVYLQILRCMLSFFFFFFLNTELQVHKSLEIIVLNW